MDLFFTSGWYIPSRNTDQGVYLHGELKGLKPEGEGKPTFHSHAMYGEGRGLKGPLVMGVRLETGRSCPEQDEAGRKLGRGPKGS